MQNLLETIEVQFKTYSPSQKKVAEYLFHNLSEAILLSSAQIANKANVSEATITRFITRLGYSGLAEFKRKAGKQLLGGYYTPNMLTESAETIDGKESALMEILRADIENIKKLANNVPEALFNKAVQKLASAKSIYILGMRSSHSLAIYMAFNLRFHFNSVHVISSGIEDIPEQILNVGKGDCLIAISFKRYTRIVLNIAEKVRDKGAYLIAITGSHLSPIAQVSDTVLVANTEIPSYFNSYSAAMSLMNALITAIALKKKNKALPALKRLEKEFEDFNLFLE